MNLKRKIRILKDINWSFSSRIYMNRDISKIINCRKYFWYPATFIPEIPYTLIELLSETKEVVFDPFGGIGTTFFQALLLGRIPYTSDCSSVATRFIKWMWDLLANTTIDYYDIPQFIQNELHKFNNKENYYSKNIELKKDYYLKLSEWFDKDILNEILFISNLYHRVGNIVLKAAIGISLSACLKTLTAQNRGWGCIADNMKPKQTQFGIKKHATIKFLSHLKILINDIIRIRQVLPLNSLELLDSNKSKQHIFNIDISNSQIANFDYVDLIITSPPYPNMVDYSMSQRLVYYLFNNDPETDLNSEIGARRKRFKKNSLTIYKNEMIQAFDNIMNTLKDQGIACFILPYFNIDNVNNTSRRSIIIEILKELDKYSLNKIADFQRFLPRNKRDHNQKWASLNSERILIYRKEYV